MNATPVGVHGSIALEKPTTVRWRLFGVMLVVVTLTFIDRFNMNVAAKYIQQEFGLSNVQVGGLPNESGSSRGQST